MLQVQVIPHRYFECYTQYSPYNGLTCVGIQIDSKVDPSHSTSLCSSTTRPSKPRRGLVPCVQSLAAPHSSSHRALSLRFDNEIFPLLLAANIRCVVGRVTRGRLAGAWGHHAEAHLHPQPAQVPAHARLPPPFARQPTAAEAAKRRHVPQPPPLGAGGAQGQFPSPPPAADGAAAVPVAAAPTGRSGRMWSSGLGGGAGVLRCRGCGPRCPVRCAGRGGLGWGAGQDASVVVYVTLDGVIQGRTEWGV